MRLLLTTIGFVSCVCVVARATEDSSLAVQAQRILVTKCVSCHGVDKQEGNLRLDSLTSAKSGGDRGPAIIPRDLPQSLLIRAVLFADADLQMPPKQKLPDSDIRILSDWVQMGADWAEIPGSTPSSIAGQGTGDAFTDAENPIRRLFHGERLDLWSLQKPVKSEVPVGREHPIDAFIAHRLQTHQLQISPEADRRTLIRRLTFDLTGLPPTPAEVESFAGDSSPGAWESLVDRLLGSPAYGERQARLWLDVVRYADTQGYERDELRPLAWQYRDYVVRSFREDKPWNQFIREQLAGDELVQGVPQTPAEADQLIATGYLRIGQWDSTAAIFQEEDRVRAETLADLTNTTASAFLGLTMSCCQCHDHKYEPLSQADHYRFRAFFAGVNFEGDIPVALVSEQTAIEAHNAAIQASVAELKSRRETLDAGREENRQAVEDLDRQMTELESQKRSLPKALGVREQGPDAPATHVLSQGDHLSPREEVAPGFLSVLSPGAAKISPPREDTSGRRLALANWIASPENPWTARVIVNRVWQQHFGTGLVATPNDFGYTGDRPSHPELLDWLAVTFMEQGWSIRELHRRIVLSVTYRQSSQDRPEGRPVDPENRLLWRQNRQRLDAETLRDSLLSVSGLLRPCSGGDSRWPAVPEELLQAQPGIAEALEGKDDGRRQGWYTNSPEETDVRSLYLIRKRCLPIPFLQVFDLPEATTSCARRETTVVAPQALMLLNSPEGLRFAQALSARVLHAGSGQNSTETTRQSVSQLFQFALQRNATAEEMQLAEDFLHRHTAAHSSAGKTAEQLALTDLCRAVLNLNEFVYVD